MVDKNTTDDTLVLWDTVDILIAHHKITHATTVFKSIIWQTFSMLKLSSDILQQATVTLPFPKLLQQLRTLDIEIKKNINTREIEKAHALFLEYLEQLNGVLYGNEKDSLNEQVLKELLTEHFHYAERIHESKVAYTVAPQNLQTYSPSEAAKILGVSDQTIRRMCKANKFPGAFQSDGGHWKIPTKHFKVTPEEAREGRKNMNVIHEKNKEVLGDDINEFDFEF